MGNDFYALHVLSDFTYVYMNLKTIHSITMDLYK